MYLFRKKKMIPITIDFTSILIFEFSPLTPINLGRKRLMRELKKSRLERVQREETSNGSLDCWKISLKICLGRGSMSGS